MKALGFVLIGAAIGVVLIRVLPAGDSPSTLQRYPAVNRATAPLSRSRLPRRGVHELALEPGAAITPGPLASDVRLPKQVKACGLAEASDVMTAEAAVYAAAEGHEKTQMIAVRHEERSEELVTPTSSNSPVEEEPRVAGAERPLPSDAANSIPAGQRPQDDCACGTAGRCPGGRSGAWTLPQPGFLQSLGLRIGGWIAQGAGVPANQPSDNYNGPIIFNDRDGEWQVNQIWLYAEREVDTGGHGWDVGGRIDFMYGTDARFIQALDGLEADWNQNERFYQAALPQFYLDVGYRDWTLRIGHFFTIIGYEPVTAPDTFFYSHPYTMQYGEPLTHTGMLLMRDVGRFSLTAGLHRGNDQFNDTDGRDALNFLGGLAWTSPQENLSLAFALSATEDGPGVSTTIYSLVGTWNVTDRLTYVIHHDCGQTTGLAGQPPTVEWYSLDHYFLYEINDCWGAGLRCEWFRDDDGTRVVGLGDGNLATGPFIGDFYAVTAGLNWRPHPNVTVRPEVRWDWFDGVGLPYDAGADDQQFLWACDVVCTF